jgi:hypothetical protein
VTTWGWVLVAAVACLAIKLLGYLVPPQVLENPRVAHTAGMVTVGLLAALVVIQTFGGPGGSVVLDARLVAIGVAAIALACRAPFLVVVVLGAASAALVRMLGWG